MHFRNHTSPLKNLTFLLPSLVCRQIKAAFTYTFIELSDGFTGCIPYYISAKCFKNDADLKNI